MVAIEQYTAESSRPNPFGKADSLVAQELFDIVEQVRQSRRLEPAARLALHGLDMDAWMSVSDNLLNAEQALPYATVIAMRRVQDRLARLLPDTGLLLMGEQADRAPDDYMHQLRVGTSMATVLRHSPQVTALPPQEQEELINLAVIAGCLHDCGKSGPHTGLGLGGDNEIRALARLPRRLRPAEIAVMGKHPHYGAERLREFADRPTLTLFEQERLLAAAILVQNHHAGSVAGLPKHLDLLLPLLQCCDVADAMTEPVVGNRSYLMDRMIKEGAATLRRHPSGMYVFSRQMGAMRTAAIRSRPQTIAGMEASQVAETVFRLKGFVDERDELLGALDEPVAPWKMTPSLLAEVHIYRRPEWSSQAA